MERRMESRGMMEESFGLCNDYIRRLFMRRSIVSSIKKKWPFDAKKEPRFLLHFRFSFLSLLPIKEVNTRSPTVSRAEHVCAKLLLGWYRIARYTLLRMKEAGGWNSSERSCQSKLFSRQKLKRLILFEEDTAFENGTCTKVFGRTQTRCT